MQIIPTQKGVSGCVNTCIDAYIDVQVYAYTRTYACTDLYVYIYIYNIRICICICINRQQVLYDRIRVFNYVCIYLFIYMY